MSSKRKIKANRQNAQVSTGPRTKAGKARSARNAMRHGLAIPIVDDPAYTKEIATFAKMITGQDFDPDRVTVAHQIASAHFELARIQRIRRHLCAQMQQCLKNAVAADYKVAKENHSPSFATITKRLVALDRYERRAFSRWKFAVRDFDGLPMRPA